MLVFPTYRGDCQLITQALGFDNNNKRTKVCNTLKIFKAICKQAILLYCKSRCFFECHLFCINISAGKLQFCGHLGAWFHVLEAISP